MERLLDEYHRVRRDGARFDEEKTKLAFVSKMLELLGWDMASDSVQPEQRTLKGRADFGMRIDKKTKFYVEVKALDADLDGYQTARGKKRTYVEQTLEYAWSTHVEWAVLTNFVETRLYYSLVRKPGEGLVYKLGVDDYLTEEGLRHLQAISKTAVSQGSLDRLVRLQTRPDITEEASEVLDECRIRLSEDVIANNPDIDKDLVQSGVLKILNRLLFTRILEDKEIESSDSLWKLYEYWREHVKNKRAFPFVIYLRQKFRELDDGYNTKIFEPHPCEQLSISSETISTILEALYRYNWEAIDADVFGAIYENYLGNVLEAKEKGFTIRKSNSKRKEEGVYYTPPQVVSFIVERTVGRALDNLIIEVEDLFAKGEAEKAEQVFSKIRDIKVLDPACGSGSFLIKVYDTFERAYTRYNRVIERNSDRTRIVRRVEEIPDFNIRILLDNIYGVDLDADAVEFATVNLALRAAAKSQRLPSLKDNIKLGNSLIHPGASAEKLFKTKGRHLFDWGTEFPNVTQGERLGFDFIVGNPPHGAKLSEEERAFFEVEYRLGKGYKNTASLFMERAYALLRDGGQLGFVIPKSLTYSQVWESVRGFLLDSMPLNELVDISKAFKSVLLEQVIVLSTKMQSHAEGYTTGVMIDGDVEERAPVPYRMAKELQILPTGLTREDISILEGIAKTQTLGETSKTRRGLPVQKWTTERRTEWPLLRGDDIRPFSLIKPTTYATERALESVGEAKLEWLKQPKVVSQRIVAHVLYPADHLIIMSSVDHDGLLSVDTVENTVINEGRFPVEFIAGLMNSTFVSWFLYHFVFNKAIRTMDLDDYYIGKIPLPKASKKDIDTVVSIVNRLQQLTGQRDSIMKLFPRDSTLDIEAMVSRYRDKYTVSALAGTRLPDLNKMTDLGVGTFRLRQEKETIRIVKGDGHDLLSVTIKDSRIRQAIGTALYVWIAERKNTTFPGSIVLGVPKGDVEDLRHVVDELIEKESTADLVRVGETIEELHEKLDDTVFRLFGIKSKDAEYIKKLTPYDPYL